MPATGLEEGTLLPRRYILVEPGEVIGANRGAISALNGRPGQAPTKKEAALWTPWATIGGRWRPLAAVGAWAGAGGTAS